MKKSALAAFAAVSATSLVLLAVPSASAQVVTDISGPNTVIAAPPSTRTTVVTHHALDPNTISGPHYWMYTDDGNPGGRIDFWPAGDIFELCDIQADGHSVYAGVAPLPYKAGDSFSLSVGGNGTCVVARGSQGGVYDLPEEACINVWIELNNLPDSADGAYWLNDNDIKANC